MSEPTLNARRGQKLRERSIRSVLLVALTADVAMAAGKGLYGHISGSLGMVSDGLHSGVHALGGIIGLIGVSLAARPADADHPYGYERYESLASMGIAAFMLVAFWNILKSAWSRAHVLEVPRADSGSFAVMGVALLLTLGLASWERGRAHRIGSTVLHADASRVWADVLVSASVLVGLMAAWLGFPRVDTLVSVLVAGAIGWSAWGIIRRASRILTDAAVGDAATIAAIARSVEGVIDCHKVRARGAGGMVRVDLHVTVHPQMRVTTSHEIAEEVERRVRERIGGIAEVLVHIGAAKLHTPVSPVRAARVSRPSFPQPVKGEPSTLTEIREELLSQHASLRSLAEEVQRAAERPPSTMARDEIAQLLEALGAAVEAHNQREQELLGDVVPTIDAWGTIRAAEMDEHHRQEHVRLRDAARAAADTSDFSLASRAALRLVEDLQEHMHAEEEVLLNPEILRDDTIVIDQVDG